MHRYLPLVLAAGLAVPAFAQNPADFDWNAVEPGGSLPGNPQIALEEVATGFVDPVNVVSANDGSGRLFVVERHGVVRIVQDGQVLDEPFLDISDITLSAFLEQGLYDIAFHPDFKNNGYVFIHFAELLRNGDSVYVRYKVSDSDPNKLDPESAKVILIVEQPWANHNGGEIEFGPDGMLWIGSGDGGWEGDPLEAGQDINSLLGKMLRIDVDVPDDQLQAYAIPADNPFAQPLSLVQLFGVPESTFARIHTAAKPEIWAYGLRNPWKFHFDPQTGDLWLPDVGQNHWEEINFVPAGQGAGWNFGWDPLMGTYCFPIPDEFAATHGRGAGADGNQGGQAGGDQQGGGQAEGGAGAGHDHSSGQGEGGGEGHGMESAPPPKTSYAAGESCARLGVPPVAQYSHDLGCAVIGIGVYRGEEISGLDGAYVFGDYCSGTIWGVGKGDDGSWQMAELHPGGDQITGGGVGEDGALYVTTCQCNYGGPAATDNPPGTLWRIVTRAQQ